MNEPRPGALPALLLALLLALAPVLGGCAILGEISDCYWKGQCDAIEDDD